MSTMITVIVHHGGILLRNERGVLEYVGGEMDVWDELDSDTLNVFDLFSIVKVCKGYDKVDKLWWLKPDRDLDIGLRELTCDSSFIDMVKAALLNGNEIEIYHEYAPEPLQAWVPNQEALNAANMDVDECHMSPYEDNHSTADESAEDSHYKPPPVVISSDDYEEVVLSKNEGKKAKGNKVAGTSSKGKKVKGNKVAGTSSKGKKAKGKKVVGTSSNGKKAKGKKASGSDGKGKKKVSSKSRERSPSPSNGDSSDDNDGWAEFYTGHEDFFNYGELGGGSNQVQQEVVSDASYKSEEMKDPISTDEENNGTTGLPNFPQFNDRAKFGNVNLVLGMEFTNLSSFKAAVKDYTIHMGRPIKWVKNDSFRARAKCKEVGCEWEIYCGRSNVRRSFQIKTFKETHSCCRAFKKIPLNIYDLDGSSTSKNVLCNSSLCDQKQCNSTVSNCPYRLNYLSANTSSTGFLVEDVLHLITDDDQTKDADTRITFGCGKVQTGEFLKGAAPNGLLGLGMESVSVPSILSKQGLTSNSFSMCFGSDGLGRITFGDSGSSDQGKTPFNLRALHPTYNITITQIIVGGNASDLEFHAIFDSGTSYTYLNDPAYTGIAEKFNSLIKAKRYSSQSSDSVLPFEYCYDISSSQQVEVPFLNLTMKGGDDYYVMDPLIQVSIENVGNFLCLAILKSENINIIGQNFMTGYHIVFDRDNMNLGWKESNCYDVLSNSLPISPLLSPAVSPAMAVNPVATSNPSSNPERLSPNRSFRMKPSFAFIMTLFSLLAIF